VLGRAGRLDELATEYRALVRIAPNEPRYVIELAELLRTADRLDEARALLADVSRRSRDPAMHERLAETWARWGDAERAESELDLLTRLDPEEPVHLVALGSQRFAAGDREGAMSAWRRILGAPPASAEAHAMLGGILADHDLLSESVAEYEEAARLAPESVDVLRGLATVLERAGQDEAAEARWMRVLALAGDDRAARREARERIVGTWARTRRIDEQVRRLDRAFSGEPPDLAAGHLLAEAHRRRRDLPSAERVLARLGELEPGDVETLVALERVRTQAGDLAGAIEALRRLVEVDPRRAAGHLERMAAHALALYRDEEALGYATEAVERNPDDAGAHRRLGDLQRARQDAPAAIASYRRALDLDDRLFDVAFELAEMHLARSEAALADRVYRDVLARAPDDDLVARAARASMQIHVGAGTLDVLERELVPLAMTHPDRPVYRRAVVEVYDAITAPLLVRARRPGPAGEAAQGALRRYGSRALKPLLEALHDRGDAAQQRVALAVLGSLGNPAAAPALLATAESSENSEETRVLALLAGGAVAEAPLAARFVALSRDPRPRVRAAACYGLARLGGSLAAEALRARLEDDDRAVRGWAALGLGRAGDRTSAPRIRAMLGDPRADAQASAALALGWLRDREAIPSLVSLAREALGPTAEAAIGALAAYDDAGARAAIAAQLFDPEVRERRAAAAALRRRLPRPADLAPPLSSEGPAEYVGRLVLATDASDVALPPPELAALSPALASAVREVVRDGPPARTQAALGVLGAEPAPLGLGELTRDAGAWPADVRARADESLGALARSLLPELRQAAASPDASIRAEAVRVLARIDEPTAGEAVAAALDDAAASVRRAALDSLGLGAAVTPEASARVASMLASHRDWAMRTRAARALGRIGGDAAVPALAAALRSDSFAFVREAAAEALGRAATSPEAASALSAACRGDAEERVRAAARAAVGAPCD
jgi:tetratricopeptide (TPR) repeat protein